MNSSGLLFIVILIIALLILLITWLIKRDTYIYISCWWCGNTFAIKRRDYNKNKRYYCSGRCIRAEEASRGIKNKYNKEGSD